MSTSDQIETPSPRSEAARHGLVIVIINYRTPGMTINCLRSLEPEVTPGGYEVMIVDNASGDGSDDQIEAEIVKNHWGGWARLIRSPHNGGFSAGNNLAIEQALQRDPQPKYILLLNPDTLVRPGAIGALIEFMEQHPDVGIAGSRLENEDGSVQVSAFRFPSICSELERGLRLGFVTRLLKDRIVSPPAQDRDHPIDWVAGASMIIRREVFGAVGLLDAGYFMYFEEVDFCLRAKRAGWPCWYVPRSRVVHLVGQSSGVTDTQRPAIRRPPYWFNSRNRFFRKNYGVAVKLLADVAWALGYACFRLRTVVQRKPSNDPPWLLWDFIRYSLIYRLR